MSTPPAFRFYASDFLSDGPVMEMTYAERGVYITLLCIAWNEEGIPADTNRMRRLLRLSETEFEETWPAIKPCWKGGEKGRLVNPRMERERKQLAEWREKSSNGGQKSAEGRKGKLTKPEPDDQPPRNISYEVWNMTSEILSRFNAVAETRFTGRDFRIAIARRVEKHPDLTVDDHEAIIRRCFAKPWWEDAPSPSVIYGSASQFERSMHTGTGKQKRADGPKRSPEAEARIAAWSKPVVA